MIAVFRGPFSLMTAESAKGLLSGGYTFTARWRGIAEVRAAFVHHSANDLLIRFRAAEASELTMSRMH